MPINSAPVNYLCTLNRLNAAQCVVVAVYRDTKVMM